MFGFPSFIVILEIFAFVSTVNSKAIRNGTPFSEIVGKGEFAVRPAEGLIALRFAKGKACSLQFAHIIGNDKLVYFHAEVEEAHIAFNGNGVPFGGKNELDLALAINGSLYNGNVLLELQWAALSLEADGSVKFNVSSITDGCSFPIVSGKVVEESGHSSTDTNVLPEWAIALTVIGGIVVIAGVAGLLIAFRHRIFRCCRPKPRAAVAPLQEAVVEPLPPPAVPVPSAAPPKMPEVPVVPAPPPTPLPPPSKTTVATTEATTTGTPTPTATPPPPLPPVVKPSAVPPAVPPSAERPKRRSAPEARERVRKSAVSSGSSGRKRSKKLLQNTFDFVEPDKVTGAPRRRSEPRSRPQSAPPPSEEAPVPTTSTEQKPGVVGAVKAKAEAVADACCHEDKGGKTETASKDDAKPAEKMLTYPLTDASEHPSLESQDRPEEPPAEKAKRSKEAKVADKKAKRKSGSRQSGERLQTRMR